MSNFSNFRTAMRGKVVAGLGLKESTPEEQAALEAKKADNNEKQQRLLLEGCREIFLEYGLSGNVSIETSFAAMSYSISLDIDPEDDEEEDKEIREEAKAELAEAKKSNNIFSLTMASIRKNVKSCQRRAQTYKNRKYRKGLMIGRGFSLTGPMIAIASISISIEMTVESLLRINKEIEEDSDDEVGGAKY